MGKIESFFSDVDRLRFYCPKIFYEIIIQGHIAAKKKKEYKNEEDMECKRLASKNYSDSTIGVIYSLFTRN